MEKKPLKVRLAVYTLILLLLIVALGKLGAMSWIFSSKQSFFASKTFSFSFLDQGLSGIVNSNLFGAKGEYAIYIESLTSGEKYSLNDQDSFPAASLYKVYLMAAVLEAIDAGQLTLDAGLTAQKSYLTQRFGSVDFGYEGAPETISYSVDEAMQRLGRISDNFAAIMLAEKVGWDKVQSMAEKLGAVNTTIKDPFSTTAADIGLFFKKLYLGEVISQEASSKIADYLSLSKINDRIPAGVPDTVKVVHKTGELAGVRNDAGIVYLEGKPYVIVMLGKEVVYEDSAMELEAKVSKEVYEYFAGKK